MDKHEAGRILGSKGGRLGGVNRMALLTVKQRRELARKAATARWIKYKENKMDHNKLRELAKELFALGHKIMGKSKIAAMTKEEFAEWRAKGQRTLKEKRNKKESSAGIERRDPSVKFIAEVVKNGASVFPMGKRSKYFELKKYIIGRIEKMSPEERIDIQLEEWREGMTLKQKNAFHTFLSKFLQEQSRKMAFYVDRKERKAFIFDASQERAFFTSMGQRFDATEEPEETPAETVESIQEEPLVTSANGGTETISERIESMAAACVNPEDAKWFRNIIEKANDEGV